MKNLQHFFVHEHFHWEIGMVGENGTECGIGLEARNKFWINSWTDSFSSSPCPGLQGFPGQNSFLAYLRKSDCDNPETFIRHEYTKVAKL